MTAVLYDPELTSEPGPYATVEFDCVVAINHSARAQATRDPVEEGADISDHTKPEPREVVLAQAIISNFPLAFAPEALDRQTRDVAQAAWRQLEAWRASGTPLTLLTQREIFDRVVIEDISDTEHPSAIRPTIKCVEIVTVQTQSTTVPRATSDRMQQSTTKNKQPKTPVETPSIREQALDAIRSFRPPVR